VRVRECYWRVRGGAFWIWAECFMVSVAWDLIAAALLLSAPALGVVGRKDGHRALQWVYGGSVCPSFVPFRPDGPLGEGGPR